jgi:methionyl-tRNA formyltransferase
MNKSELKLVFMGTSEFSAKILQGIIDDGYNVVGVISESDKPTGRKMEILPTPVKKLALEKGIKVLQPENKSDLQLTTYNLQPDLIIVAAYGKILPKEVLETQKYGCVNFHPSLLPLFRGATPMEGALLAGLKETGVTIMLLDEGVDSGGILSQEKTQLDDRETYTSLKEKVLQIGIPLLLKTLPGYIDGEIKPIAQDSSLATYCEKTKKEDGHINFYNLAETEERKIRAYNEWPGAFAFWNEKRIKFLDVNYELRIMNHEAGTVFLDENKNLCIAFAEGYWIVNKLQIEGGNPLSAKDFLNGNKNIVGAILG